MNTSMKQIRKSNFIILLSLAYLSISCSQVKISAISNVVKADDGFNLISYELYSGSKFKLIENPRAIFFYVQGSEYETVTSKIHYMASAVILGSRAIMMEKRGCYYNRVDTSICYQFADKSTRVKDHLSVIESYLKNIPDNIPVVLIGGSEGGDVSSVIAEKFKRINYLILIGSGGGWSQKTELRYLVTANKNYLGCKNVSELNNIFDKIGESGHENKTWAGHPFRRWKTFLNDSNLIYLRNLNIPILLLQGESDSNVPVESARNLQNEFNVLKKTNLTYIEYKKVDHKLNNIFDKKSRYPLLEIDIIAWLNKYGLVSNTESEKFVHRIKKAHKDIFN